MGARGRPRRTESGEVEIGGCHRDQMPSDAELVQSARPPCSILRQTLLPHAGSAPDTSRRHLRIPRRRLREIEPAERPFVSLAEMRWRTSSQGIVLALPDSSSAMRRAISSFQAASTAAGSSCLSSRLSSSESASSARSSVLSARAFFSSSLASCVMVAGCSIPPAQVTGNC